MNQIKMLLGAALLSGLISTSVYAGSGAPANPPRGGTAVPHPEVMVGPEDLPRRFLDVTVKVTFTVMSMKRRGRSSGPTITSGCGTEFPLGGGLAGIPEPA